MTRYDTISFLSDYGTVDEFAGVCRAVIRDLAPHVTVVDIAHDLPPHDVRAGALCLVRAIQYLPEGVVLAVVDPGVATGRRAIAVEVGGGSGVLVGPDNGLLAPAVSLSGGAGRVVEISDPRFGIPAPGATFGGRDVFAPAAAHICNGVDISELGPAIDGSTLLPGVLPVPQADETGISAEVLWIDRFGNAQLNVGPDDVEFLGDPLSVVLDAGRRTAHRVDAYDDIGPGRIGLVTDSYGLLSISLMRTSAAAELDLHEATGVRLEAVDANEGGVVVPVELRRREG